MNSFFRRAIALDMESSIVVISFLVDGFRTWTQAPPEALVPALFTAIRPPTLVGINGFRILYYLMRCSHHTMVAKA
jgi:hypothetical protein